MSWGGLSLRQSSSSPRFSSISPPSFIRTLPRMLVAVSAAERAAGQVSLHVHPHPHPHTRRSSTAPFVRDVCRLRDGRERVCFYAALCCLCICIPPPSPCVVPSPLDPSGLRVPVRRRCCRPGWLLGEWRLSSSTAAKRKKKKKKSDATNIRKQQPFTWDHTQQQRRTQMQMHGAACLPNPPPSMIKRLSKLTRRSISFIRHSSVHPHPVAVGVSHPWRARGGRRSFHLTVIAC